MKVLFWVSPVTEMASPWQKLWWMMAFVPQIQASLCKAGYSIDSTSIVSVDLNKAMTLRDVHVDGRVVAMSQHELLDGYRYNELFELTTYQQTRKYSVFFEHLSGLIIAKLGADYIPDLIISFSPSPFFNKIYPDALMLYHEYGVFSRAPYPETYFFDPFGQTSRNFVATYSRQINAIRAESDGYAKELGAFRQKILLHLKSIRGISRYFDKLRKHFRRLVLVPLGADYFYDARVNFPYQSQFEMVEHILDTVDSDTGVVLTQHPSCPALSSSTVEALKSTHTNLVNEGFYAHVENFSQIAIVYCDVCVTQNSTVAYQAAFLGKRLVTIGGFCDGIADGCSVCDLARVFDAPPTNRDNFFVWVIRHHITDVEDMPRHLKRLVEAWHGNPSEGKSLESWPVGLSLEEFRDKLRAWGNAARAPVCSLKGCCSFFFDQGSDFSEDNSIRVIRTDTELLDEEIPLPPGCKRLRFDPVEGSAVLCEELTFSANDRIFPVVAVNGTHTTEGWLSLSQDPEFICNIPSGVSSVRVRAKFRSLSEPEALMRCERERRVLQDAVAANKSSLAGVRTELDRLVAERDRLVAERDRLACENDHVSADLADCRAESAVWKGMFLEISESNCWRITKPIRWVLDTFKVIARKTS